MIGENASAAPTVSVGMPVYNGELFIREAVDSILAQTFGEFELIIADNASTDATEAICREYAARDARIRYVRHSENRGPAFNFQYVLDAAIGKYFMWAAVDDRREREFLRMATEILDSCEAAGLVCSWQETRNLFSGESYRTEIGFTSSRRKLFRIVFRIHEVNPCLVYGLHRMSVLRKLKVESIDYWDVYLAHWYELNAKIVVVPAYLFVSGSKGRRIAYSMEGGRYLTHRKYLARNWTLFNEHFGRLVSVFLLGLTWWLIAKTTRRANADIKANAPA
jgi:glycosyltransferase involved in cell wall biosynthesis